MASNYVAIRYINNNPDGSVAVGYTLSATSPVPSGVTGEYIFSSLPELQKQIKEMNLPDYILILLHLAITWLQPNGSFGNTTQVLNKTIAFDSTAAQPLKIV